MSRYQVIFINILLITNFLLLGVVYLNIASNSNSTSEDLVTKRLNMIVNKLDIIHNTGRISESVHTSKTISDCSNNSENFEPNVSLESIFLNVEQAVESGIQAALLKSGQYESIQVGETLDSRNSGEETNADFQSATGIIDQAIGEGVWKDNHYHNILGYVNVLSSQQRHLLAQKISQAINDGRLDIGENGGIPITF